MRVGITSNRPPKVATPCGRCSGLSSAQQPPTPHLPFSPALPRLSERDSPGKPPQRCCGCQAASAAGELARRPHTCRPADAGSRPSSPSSLYGSGSDRRTFAHSGCRVASIVRDQVSWLLAPLRVTGAKAFWLALEAGAENAPDSCQ